MQTHGGANAEAAILSAEREIFAEIKVDWNWDGLYTHLLSNLSAYADEISVDRSLVGAAPAEIMLIEGSAAAELTFTVGGENYLNGQNLVSIFSPYNGVSPLYNFKTVGAEITYRLGVQTPLGVVWYPQFVGNIRTITPNRANNSVQITALDRVEKLRVPIQHTDWGILDFQANRGFVTSQLMNSQWVIDHCLKHGDTSSSPHRWLTAAEMQASSTNTNQFYLSGNGGIAPNIGWVDGSYQNQFPDSDVTPALSMYHDLGQAHPNSPEPTKRPQMLRAQRNWGNDFNIFWANDKLESAQKVAYQFHMTLHTQTFAGSEWYATMPDSTIFEYQFKDTRAGSIMIGAGQVWIRYVDTNTGLIFNSTKLNIPSGAGNEYVRISAAFKNIGSSSTETCQLKVNSTVTSVQNMQAGYGYLTEPSTSRIRLWRKVALQDISVITRFATNGFVDTPTAKYTAVVDRGLNKLSFLPKRRGALAWDVITEVAAAEFGAVFWDESGVFHFWNQDTVSSKKDTVVRSFTLNEVSGLEITTSLDSVRNMFSITAKKSRVQSTIVYATTGPDELILPPGQFTDLRVWIDNIVTPNSGQPTNYRDESINNPSTPVWNDDVRFGVAPQYWTGSAWANANFGGSWRGNMYRARDGACIVHLWNGAQDPIRFAVGEGSPAFRWDGSQLTAFDDQVFSLVDEESMAKWGSQGLELGGDWYQEFYAAGTFLSNLLSRTSQPIPTTQAITIAGDPRLQLGDGIRVIDSDGMGEDMRMQILGIRRTFSRTAGLVDDLSVEMTQPPQIGLWDSAQYGIWGQTFYWSA